MLQQIGQMQPVREIIVRATQFNHDIVLIILNINNLNDINIMSAKTVIQALEDSDLIKIFLDFVQLHRLQYEKVHKEISYKCFEATWMLNIVKATGYGRTET